MVIWFNVKEAREFLFEKGLVYTVRNHAKNPGRHALSYGKRGSKGEVWLEFVRKVIKYDLEPYVQNSGFEDIDHWWFLTGAEDDYDSRYLFRVILIWRKDEATGKVIVGPLVRTFFGRIALAREQFNSVKFNEKLKYGKRGRV